VAQGGVLQHTGHEQLMVQTLSQPRGESAKWSPRSRAEEAFLGICERAYSVDPDRTYNELTDMGLRNLASQLKVSYQLGQLETPESR